MVPLRRQAAYLTVAVCLQAGMSSVGHAEGAEDTAPAESAAAAKSAAPAGGKVEKIVVTGRYVSQSVDKMRFSDSVADMLSAEDFAVTGDSDVAGALARVTGVTVVDNKFVYVRGLGERYSSTLFNSAILPSPDPARRVLPLDLFPSGVMRELNIQKTYSPRLPGDFSGGVLEMNTRLIPDERESSWRAAVEYNTETTLGSHPFYQGSDSDWTGFTSGARDLPGVIDNYLSAAGTLSPGFLLSPEELATVGRSLPQQLGRRDVTALPNLTLGYSIGDSMETPAGDAGYLIGMRYSNSWQFTSEARRTSEPDGTGSFDVADDILQDETVNTIGYSLLTAGQWEPSNAHKLGGTVFVTRLTDKRMIEENGFLDENNRDVSDVWMEWEERQLAALRLDGEHRLPGSLGLGANWGATFSRATREKPDTRFYRWIPNASGVPFFDSERSGNLRQWEELTDDALDLTLAFDAPVSVTDSILATIETGARFFLKERDSVLRRFRYKSAFPGQFFDEEVSDLPDDELFADDLIGKGQWELEESTQFTDSHTAEENVIAGYVQGDVEFGPDLRVMAGARYEASTQKTATKAVRGGAAQVSRLDGDHILPAVSATWSVTPDMQLRAAWSRTLNRPDIREISPAPYIDPEDRDVLFGNPNLQIAQITNYDLRWEYYPGGLDSLSLAVFYKDFDSPIEETLWLAGGQVRRTYENSETAELYGLEFSTRQTLERLSKSLRDFYVKLNGSLMRSEVEASANAINQTNQVRRLQGQSDWVANAQLTYDDSPNDRNVTLAFNVAGDRISDVGVRSLDDAVEKPRPVLDLNIRQGVDILGVPVDFGLRATNLFDSAYRRERGPVVERDFRSGRSVQLSARVRF